MRTPRFIYVLIIIIGIRNSKSDDECSRKTSHLPMVRLKHDLLCNYDKTIRPVVNQANTTTDVFLTMILKRYSYDSHSGIFSVDSWVSVFWSDEHLKWDKTKYDNLGEIHISSTEIWKPDFILYNSENFGGSLNELNDVDCLITTKGKVVCISPNRHEGNCLPNLRKYPFDYQNCTLEFGSWVHKGNEVEFLTTPKIVSLKQATPDPDWELLDGSVVRQTNRYDCCLNSSFPTIYYSFYLKRNSSTFAAIVTIPAFVMVILTLAVLWMNPEETNRLCLACSNLMVQMLYLQILRWDIPSTGDEPPLLILFGRDSLLLCTFSIILTIFLKNMISSSKSSPIWVSTIISGIISNRPGQLFLLHDISLKHTATVKGDDDAENIINEANPISLSEDWRLFAKLIDKLSFISFFIVYCYMFICFIL